MKWNERERLRDFFMWIKCMLNVSLNAKDRKPSSALDSQHRGADFYFILLFRFKITPCLANDELAGLSSARVCSIMSFG